MAIINTADDLQDIRQLVSDSFSTDSLPDSSIQRDIFLGLAERVVLGRLDVTETTFTTLTIEKQAKAKISIKYYTAALILATIETVVSESILGVTIRRESVSVNEKIKSYRSIANKEVPETDSSIFGISFASKISGRL